MVQKLTTSHSYDVLKTRPKRSGDTGRWTEIYQKQVGFASVWEWLLAIAGIGLAGFVGYQIGSKLCGAKFLYKAGELFNKGINKFKL